MALGGTLVIENFKYGVSEAEFPLFDEDGPMLDPETDEQRTVQCKIISMEPVAGVRVEIRIAEADWDNFLAEISKKKVVVADLADLAELTEGN